MKKRVYQTFFAPTFLGAKLQGVVAGLATRGAVNSGTERSKKSPPSGNPRTHTQRALWEKRIPIGMVSTK